MNASKSAGAIVLIVVLATWAYIALTSETRLPISTANGSYSNPCCGMIVIANGVMTVAAQPVSYVIEQDKVGPYVLPKVYVGASDRGIVTRSDGYPLKLRLDRPVRPQTLDLVDDAPGGKAYSFVRENGS